MTLRATRTILFLWCMFSFNGLEGRELSREEDMELEKQFKLMSKPTVKTIKFSEKTIHGDIYNCVDFYQQPSFDHPLLKNHTFNFQTRPPSYLKRRKYEDNSIVFNPSKIWLNGKGCPFGTVPIKRITKNDLLRAKLASEIYASKFSPQTVEIPGLHLAIIRTKVDPNKQYYGGQICATLHKVQVQSSQSSYARMKLKNNADYIEAGWMVNPIMYKDQKTRMYIYTSAGASHCFNTYCPGFVHVAPDVPLDYVLPISKPGGQIVSIKFIIDFDRKFENWNLYAGNNNKLVGYWDGRIFKEGLNEFASYIDWGGQVYGPPSIQSAPMGTGLEVTGDGKRDAFCWQVEYANETDYMAANNIEEYVEVEAYRVLDEGDVGGELGHLFYYGGPGGYTGS